MDSKLLFANENDQIAIVLLTDWLDWVTQKSRDVFVALPIIQRGSVWRPNAVVELWDSLLRGMPVGSLTVSRFETNETGTFREIGCQTARQEMINAGSLSLLDGQQRTLAMCIGWKENMDRRVWVDFGESGTGGRPFHLRVTTQFQPFGFNPSDQSKRLHRWELKKARDASGTSLPDYERPLDETEPFGAVHPLELRKLIQTWRDEGQIIEAWLTKVMNFRKVWDTSKMDVIENRMRQFGAALENLFKTQIALVRVRRKLVELESEDTSDAQPALVVLFERIANGGTRLSNSDYVFSLIKHRFPEAHNFVQQLHAGRNVSSLLTANDLVMTAVRIAANTHTHDEGQRFADNPTPSPKEFGRMLKAKVDGAGKTDFLGGALMPIVNPKSPKSLQRAFEELHLLLACRDERSSIDCGIPKLGFPLLHRQLVQVLILWIHHHHFGKSEKPQTLTRLESRAEIIRFVLFWLLCVPRNEKGREAAGKTAFEKLTDGSAYPQFPGKELYELLCSKEKAVRLVHPDNVANVAVLKNQSGRKIRSWESRFDVKEPDTQVIRDAKKLYRHWFHHRDLLLWSQRMMLEIEFKGVDPLAGREEETPYDFDHICPQGDWGRAGYGVRKPFRDFCEDGAAWIIGNSIGNYRVWDSSKNREDQADPASAKLELENADPQIRKKRLADSAILETETSDWLASSHSQGEEGNWTETRAFAFAEGVEKRAFRLFKEYFEEAGFATWVPQPSV